MEPRGVLCRGGGSVSSVGSWASLLLPGRKAVAEVRIGDSQSPPGQQGELDGGKSPCFIRWFLAEFLCRSPAPSPRWSRSRGARRWSSACFPTCFPASWGRSAKHCGGRWCCPSGSRGAMMRRAGEEWQGRGWPVPRVFARVVRGLAGAPDCPAGAGLPPWGGGTGRSRAAPLGIWPQRGRSCP